MTSVLRFRAGRAFGLAAVMTAVAVLLARCGGEALLAVGGRGGPRPRPDRVNSQRVNAMKNPTDKGGSQSSNALSRLSARPSIRVPAALCVLLFLFVPLVVSCEGDGVKHVLDGAKSTLESQEKAERDLRNNLAYARQVRDGLAEENVALEAELATTLKRLEATKQTIVLKQAEVSVIKEEIDRLQSQLAKSEDQLKAKSEELESLNSLLNDSESDNGQ